MQLQIVLILFTINFTKILTQNGATKNAFKTTKNQTPSAEIDNTPSPEWIKYQLERFKDMDKLHPTYGETKTTNNGKRKQSVVAKVSTKMETTSRQEGSSRNEKEEGQQSGFEGSDSDHTEKSGKEKLPSTNAVEFPSIQGFIEFIKSLKQTWMKKTLFRIDDKIKMLHQLKDKLLKTIEQQFMILWQDDDDEDDEEHFDENENRNARNMRGDKPSNHLRSKRGILDESSINFPPDAALMSINFLTFAVFLIKLVLQVVNIIKTKHYQFSSFNTDTGAIRNG